ncbi:MAG: AbiV family abortive infection protein [Phycisphaerales bacterium]|nr:AbiV family abortive infection protein [Phycisphaerales bacterium]
MPTDCTIEQLRDGSKKALRNASHLVNEAELLYANKAFARLRFLCSIAIEECGKYLMLISAIVQAARGGFCAKKFWKRFKNHKEKSGNVFLFNECLVPFATASDLWERAKRSALSTDHAEKDKLGALYVDWSNGSFVLPEEMVYPSMALSDLQGAKSVLAYFENTDEILFKKFDDLTQDHIRELVSRATLAFAAPRIGMPGAGDE